MLYETLSQPLILLLLLIFGFASGIVFDFANFFFILSQKNKTFRFFLDLISMVLVGLIFFLLVLKINYGEIRFYEIVMFASALFVERVLIGKIVAKFFGLCYNFFVRFLEKLKVFKKSKNDKEKT